VVRDGEADVCDYDPGFETTVTVSAALRTLVRVWRGDLSWQVALRGEAVSLDGPAEARRELPVWLGQSALAAVPRP